MAVNRVDGRAEELIEMEGSPAHVAQWKEKITMKRRSSTEDIHFINSRHHFGTFIVSCKRMKTESMNKNIVNYSNENSER